MCDFYRLLAPDSVASSNPILTNIRALNLRPLIERVQSCAPDFVAREHVEATVTFSSGRLIRIGGEFGVYALSPVNSEKLERPEVQIKSRRGKSES